LLLYTYEIPFSSLPFRIFEKGQTVSFSKIDGGQELKNVSPSPLLSRKSFPQSLLLFFPFYSVSFFSIYLTNISVVVHSPLVSARFSSS